jgi:hypothetical protein
MKTSGSQYENNFILVPSFRSKSLKQKSKGMTGKKFSDANFKKIISQNFNLLSQKQHFRQKKRFQSDYLTDSTESFLFCFGQ